MIKRGIYNDYEQAMLNDFEVTAKKLAQESMKHPSRSEATKESMIRHSLWGDPWNPLWHDEEYAKETKWGGLIAMPLYTDQADIFSYFPHLPREAGFVDHNLYGGDWTNLHPVRPTDKFTVVQHAPELIDITDDNDPNALRTFGFIERNADVYNQDGQLLSTHKHLMDIIVRPEPQTILADSLPFEDHYYTESDWSFINSIIDNEERRGANTRWWEDVQIGEELAPTTIGPSTVMDMAAYYASHEEIPIRPTRFFREEDRREGTGHLMIDPRTNVSHFAASWHFISDVARLLGNPRAFHFGDSARTQMVRLATNWIGDDGDVRSVSFRHISRTPVGDCQVGHGRVIDKFIQDGEYCVLLDVWLDNLCRGNVTEAAKIVVVLPVRGTPAAHPQQAPGKQLFRVGERVQIGKHPFWWAGGNPLVGATGTITKLYAWDEAYANFPEYVGVEIDPSSTDTKLGIGNKLMFRGEYLELI